MISKEKVYELVQFLKKSQHVRILSHRNPDGDAIGSMIAFTIICDFFNISYDLYLTDVVPYNLRFLTENVTIQFFNPKDIDELQNEQTDTVIFLDCGQLNRVGDIGEFILDHQQIINIDHHMSNPLFGDFNYVMDMSSTCELVYWIIKELDIPIPYSIATALYVGLITDTGKFQYDKVTPSSHKMAAELLECGVQADKISQLIYQSNPISWIPLLEKGLSTLELHNDNSLAIMSFTLEDLSQEDDGFDDTHVLFPIMLATESIRICVILKEKNDGTVSASLRSKDDINVAKIAQVFGGGGHIRAAGCRTRQHSLLDFKKHIYNEIQKAL